MDIESISKVIANFGFGTIAMAAILFAAWKLLEWGKGIVDTAMQQVETERIRSAEVYKKFSEAIEEHTSQAREFHMEVKNAHGYQREEHTKMIENLDEQYKILLRINGEKH